MKLKISIFNYKNFDISIKMLDYIELTPNQTIDDLLPSLLIGHTYYVNDSTSNEHKYKKYVLLPKKNIQD